VIRPNSPGLSASISHLAYQVTGRALAALPAALSTRMLASGAVLLARLDPASARIFRRNARALRPGLDSAALGRLANRMQMERLRSMHEMLCEPARDAQWLRSRVGVTGLPALEAALAAGRGAVITWNHLGCWDVGTRALGAHGHATTAQADRPLGPFLWRGAVAARARIGVRLTPRNSGLAPLLAGLGRGELAAVGWDGYAAAPGEDGLRGMRVATALAHRGGAPIFRAVCLPEAAGYALRLAGPYPAPASRREARRLAGALVAAELRLISRHLERWNLRRPLAAARPAAGARACA
jgi:lauroyl/myristoyl acyltransferase